MAKEKAILDQTSDLAKSIINPISEESFFRDADYDLKRQHLGPSFLNTQRIYELADSALYQGLYGIPGASIGGMFGGPVGAAAGFGAGGKLGTLHAALQEYERLKGAKKRFSKNEKALLNKLDKSFKNWATVSAVLGGLGGAGLGYALPHDNAANWQKYLGIGLGGLAGATVFGLLGGLAGRGIEREKLRDSSKFKKLIEHYD